MNEEQWKEIPGHPDFDISDHGRVRRRARRIKTGNRRHQPDRIMSLCKGDNGYLVASIDSKTYAVHRLVAESFVVGQAPGLIVNHKHPDGDKTRNLASNLEWVTPAGNSKHAQEILGFDPSLASKRAVIGTCISTGSEVRFDSGRDAKSSGFHPQSISNCCNGSRRKHMGRTWRFADAGE